MIFGCAATYTLVPRDLPNPTTPPQEPRLYGPCEKPSLQWQDVTEREDVSSWAGGLGQLQTNITKVWACLREPDMPAACGGGGGDLACYVFSERDRRFLFWGPNSLVRLVR